MKPTPNHVRIRAILPTSFLDMRVKTVKNAEVIEVGDDCEVKVGDRVIVREMSYANFVNDEAVVNESAILAVVETNN